jgi:hypothetical protein
MILHFTMMPETRVFACVILPVLLAALLCTPTSAGLTVAGAKYMGDIAPGDTYVHSIIVSTKPADAPMDILIDVMGFGQNTDRGYTSLPAALDTGPFTARPFITLDASSFTLKPGESKTVKATIAVPANTGAGGRYAMIYIHTKPGGGGGTMAIAAAIAVPVMVTIKGQPVTETGSVTDIKTLTKQDGRTAILTTFQHTGNHHFYNATNEVRVTDGQGREVAKVTLPPSAIAIMPGATVAFEAVTPAPLAPGTYTAESKVTLPPGTVLDTRTMTVEVAAGPSATVPPEPVGQVPAGTVAGAGTARGGTDIVSSPAAAATTYTPAPGPLVICTVLGALLIVQKFLKKN